MRVRTTIGPWRNSDVNGRPLRIATLSSKLTKVVGFRATIRALAEKAYLPRRVNGIEEPVVARAREVRERLIAVAVEMIRGLHSIDFETLTDLIFARSGWQRSIRVGGTMADIDLDMEQPTNGERAFVQVKSQANQSVPEDYIDRFRANGYDRFFFVCHSAQGSLTLPHGAGPAPFRAGASGGCNCQEWSVRLADGKVGVIPGVRNIDSQSP